MVDIRIKVYGEKDLQKQKSNFIHVAAIGDVFYRKKRLPHYAFHNTSKHEKSRNVIQILIYCIRRRRTEKWIGYKEYKRQLIMLRPT